MCRFQSGEDAQQGALAGAIDAGQRVGAGQRDVERIDVKQRARTELFAQAADSKQRRHRIPLIDRAAAYVHRPATASAQR